MSQDVIPETCKRRRWSCYGPDGKIYVTFDGRACEALGFVIPLKYETVWVPGEELPDI